MESSINIYDNQLFWIIIFNMYNSRTLFIYKDNPMDDDDYDEEQE